MVILMAGIHLENDFISLEVATLAKVEIEAVFAFRSLRRSLTLLVDWCVHLFNK